MRLLHLTAAMGLMLAAFLLSSCGDTATVKVDIRDCQFFPENEQYGYIVQASPASQSRTACYRIVVRDKAAASDTTADCFPIHITSQQPPQLADTNAVVFISPGDVRDYLVLYRLSGDIAIDTIFEFVKQRTGNSIVFPDTCLYTPDNIAYSARFGVLAWHEDLHRPYFGIEQLISRDSCVHLEQGIGGGIALTNDFSRVLFARFGYPQFGLDSSNRLLAYEFAEDTTVILYKTFEAIGPPWDQRTKDGAIYCSISHEDSYGRELFRINVDGITPLTDFGADIWISRFVLYSDSIVVYYNRRCDPDFGTKRVAIREGKE